jgi:hypothetical protein
MLTYDFLAEVPRLHVYGSVRRAYKGVHGGRFAAQGSRDRVSRDSSYKSGADRRATFHHKW